VSGFWHGASWNFIVWGGIHACYFLPLLLLNQNRKFVNNVVAQDRKLPNLKELWQMISTFVFVTFAWIFFMAHSLREAIDYIKSIFMNFNNSGEYLNYKRVFYYIFSVILIDWFMRRDERTLNFKLPGFARIIVYILIAFIILYKYNSNSNFIYFQF
jgi:D-alanyl-lipoteichoic acid acyltransferase DltB (MBOAT superfamily)